MWGENAKYMKSLFNKFDRISYSNKFLYKEFLSAKLKPKIYYTPFGVNTDIFIVIKKIFHQKFLDGLETRIER